MRTDKGDDGDPDVKWLTAEELDSWLSVVRLMTWLPWSIDQQLQRDSKLGMVDYQVLAMLSESPQRTMRLSSLAEVTERCRCPGCRGGRHASRSGDWSAGSPMRQTGGSPKQIPCEEGLQTLAEAAPRHVAHVRSLVIDVLSPEQLRRLGRDADRIMARVRHVCDQLTVRAGRPTRWAFCCLPGRPKCSDRTPFGFQTW